VSHDLSEIILYADLLLKKHFLLLSMLKTVVLLHIYVENMMQFFYVNKFSKLPWLKYLILLLFFLKTDKH